MINYLKDIKKETLIGQLPNVINSNNDSIRKEFNWIFDSSLNRLTKSVYAPTGSVKAHFGEFTNLACEYFTVKNVDSLKYSIQDSVESIINETLNVSSMQIVMAALTNIANSSFIDPKQYDISALCDISTLIVNHNVLNNRFKDVDFIDDVNQDFCHDAAAIVYQKENDKYITVKDILDNVNGNSDIRDTSILENAQNIGILNNQVSNMDSSISTIKNDISMMQEIINTFKDKLEMHYVTLDPNNGENIHKIVVVNNQPYGEIKLVVPTVIPEGKEFGGWFDDEDNEYTPETMVNLNNDNLVLTAKWNIYSQY